MTLWEPSVSRDEIVAALVEADSLLSRIGMPDVEQKQAWELRYLALLGHRYAAGLGSDLAGEAVAASSVCRSLADRIHKSGIKHGRTLTQERGFASRARSKAPGRGDWRETPMGEYLTSIVGGKLDEMTLHDDTGDARDDGYMAAVHELRDWLEHGDECD